MQADWIYRFSLSRFYFLAEILNKSNRSLRTDLSLQGAEGVTPEPGAERGSLSRENQTLSRLETGEEAYR